MTVQLRAICSLYVVLYAYFVDRALQRAGESLRPATDATESGVLPPHRRDAVCAGRRTHGLGGVLQPTATDVHWIQDVGRS